jgi:molecular chaperone GrpE
MEDDKKKEKETQAAAEKAAAADWRAKAEEYLAGWKRAMADYQNREKELGREKREFAIYAAENVISDFLPALDNLRQAFEHVPEDLRQAGWVKGIEQIVKQFEDALSSHGVSRFDSLGSDFDPSRHEAVGEEPGEEGKVVREIAPGYAAGEKVISPARVVVGSMKPVPPPN